MRIPSNFHLTNAKFGRISCSLDLVTNENFAVLIMCYLWFDKTLHQIYNGRLLRPLAWFSFTFRNMFPIFLNSTKYSSFSLYEFYIKARQRKKYRSASNRPRACAHIANKVNAFWTRSTSPQTGVDVNSHALKNPIPRARISFSVGIRCTPALHFQPHNIQTLTIFNWSSMTETRFS